MTNTGTLNIGGTSTITTLTATATGNTVNYNGTGNQTVNATDYYNLTFSGGGTNTLPTTRTTTITGNWTNNGTTIAPSTSTINFNGSSAQSIGGTSASTFNNLSVNNASGISLNAPASVAGTLTLTSGILTTTSTNLLTITNTGSITGALSTSYINGPLAMTLPTNITSDGTTYTFPVGDISNYKPLALVNIRTGATAPVIQVTENPTGATTGDGSTITSIASRNWYVQTTSGNFTSATIQLTESGLIPTNVIGKSTAQAGTYSSIGGTNIGASVTSVQTVSSLPVYFAIGISAIKPLYSYQSGNWDSTTTWTTDPSGSLLKNPRIPTSMDNVIVLNGRTVTISANTKQVVSLTMNAGGVLDLQSTTGHNLGTVTGQGKIMLSSNNFPGGTFTNFVAAGSGTIEYYNLNNVSLSTTQSTYNNLIISNTSTSAITSYLPATANPTTYTINGNFNVKNYSTGSNTASFGNSTSSNNLINMTVYGDFTVDAGCYVNVNNFASSQTIPHPTTATSTASYPVHTLYLYGNLTNNGSIRFTVQTSPVQTAYYTATTSLGAVQVYFKGATNNTVTCNGVTDFYRLVEEKGTDNTYILEVNSSDTSHFALYAPNDQGNSVNMGLPEGFGYGAYYKALFIHYGTLKLDTNIVIHSLTEGGEDFNIIPTAGLWINGANVETSTGNNGIYYQALTVYGTLKITGGTLTTKKTSGITLGTLGTPVLNIGGTGLLDASQIWTLTGGTNKMSYMQTGGTVNMRLSGQNSADTVFSLSNTNSVFVMSGGTMNFTNTASSDTTITHIIDVEAQSGNYQVTGGTINFNLTSISSAYICNSTVPLYNVNITRGSGTGKVTMQWALPSPLTVLNDLTIGSNCVLDLNTYKVDLGVGGDFTITGGGTYTPSTTGTTTFNGATDQTFSNVGTITGSTLNILRITNSSVTLITNDLTVDSLLIDSYSTLNDNGKYINVGGSVINSGEHVGLISTTTSGIRINGTAAQTIGGDGTGVFDNLIINSTSTTSVALNANIAVTGNLRLVNSTNFNIGSYSLSLDTSANVYTDMATTQSYNATHMITTTGIASDGGVAKTFSTTAKTFVYPIGTSGRYHPAKIYFTSDPAQYGSIAVRTVPSQQPLEQDTTKAIRCYWKTTSTGFSGIQNNSVFQIYYYNSGILMFPMEVRKAVLFLPCIKRQAGTRQLIQFWKHCLLEKFILAV